MNETNKIELPEEIKDKIQEWAESFKTGEWFEKLRIEAAAFGYQLTMETADQHECLNKISNLIMDYNVGEFDLPELLDHIAKHFHLIPK